MAYSLPYFLSKHHRLTAVFWFLTHSTLLVAGSLFPIDSGSTSNNKNIQQGQLQTWFDQVVTLRSVDLFRHAVHHHRLPSHSPLKYTIFQQGRSILRDIDPPTSWDIKLPAVVESDKLLVAIAILLRMYNNKNSFSANCEDDDRNLDAAHEVLLGVNHNNLAEAEYAATHRGQTPWSKQHPLDDEDDILHAILHRIEGNTIGEGGYTGWDNAKYWSAGGPKQVQILGHHPVHQALCRIYCQQQRWTTTTPLSSSNHSTSLLSVIVQEAPVRRHEIIAGGGQTRSVIVERGCWDPIAWIDICRQAVDDTLPTELWTVNDIHELQVQELCLLVKWRLSQILSKNQETNFWP